MLTNQFQSPLTLFGHPKTRSTRISWMLEELKIDYDYRLINFAQGDSRAPQYLAINPAGKVPALRLETGEILLESGAIITYLAERYGQGEWIPAEASYERAVFNQWSYFVLTELEQALWTIAKHQFALPKEHRVDAVQATARWEYQQALQLLSEGLAEHNAIMGQCGASWDRFTAVDILITHTLLWGEAFGQPMEQSNLKAYLEQNKTRPALAATTLREAALLKN